MRVKEYVDKPDQLTPVEEQSVTAGDGSGQFSVKGSGGGGGDAETQNQGKDVNNPSRGESETQTVTAEPVCAGCFACTNCVSNV